MIPEYLRNTTVRYFVDMVLDGNAKGSEVHDFVKLWHNSNSSVPLYEYLGMTEEEYAFWVEDEKNLDAILESRADEIGLGL